MSGRIVYFPLRTVEDLKDGEEVRVMRNLYWRMNQAGELAYFEFAGDHFPQCNKVAQIVARFSDGSHDIVELVPLAFAPVERDR